MNPPTPETDAAAWFEGSGSSSEVVEAKFARNIEQQRNMLLTALEESSHFWQAVSASYGLKHAAKDAELKSLQIRDYAIDFIRKQKLGSGNPVSKDNDDN
jgi:hypothetical protein